MTTAKITSLRLCIRIHHLLILAVQELPRLQRTTQRNPGSAVGNGMPEHSMTTSAHIHQEHSRAACVMPLSTETAHDGIDSKASNDGPYKSYEILPRAREQACYCSASIAKANDLHTRRANWCSTLAERTISQSRSEPNLLQKEEVRFCCNRCAWVQVPDLEEQTRTGKRPKGLNQHKSAMFPRWHLPSRKARSCTRRAA